MSWKPPKTDWDVNPINPRAADYNRIEGNIEFLKNEIEVKKGAIVDAVNTKRVNVTLENSYAEIADAIRSINLNHRVANGAGLFEKDQNSLILRIRNLDFKPSTIFVRGKFVSEYFFNGYYFPYDYNYAFVENTVEPANRMGMWNDPNTTMNINASKVIYDNGFDLVIYGPCRETQYYQYWYCYE